MFEKSEIGGDGIDGAVTFGEGTEGGASVLLETGAGEDGARKNERAEEGDAVGGELFILFFRVESETERGEVAGDERKVAGGEEVEVVEVLELVFEVTGVGEEGSEAGWSEAFVGGFYIESEEGVGFVEEAGAEEVAGEGRKVAEGGVEDGGVTGELGEAVGGVVEDEVGEVVAFEFHDAEFGGDFGLGVHIFIS